MHINSWESFFWCIWRLHSIKELHCSRIALFSFMFICHLRKNKTETNKKKSSAVPFRNNCFLFAGQTAALVPTFLLWKQYRELLNKRSFLISLIIQVKSLSASSLGISFYQWDPKRQVGIIFTCAAKNKTFFFFFFLFISMLPDSEMVRIILMDVELFFAFFFGFCFFVKILSALQNLPLTQPGQISSFCSTLFHESASTDGSRWSHCREGNTGWVQQQQKKSLFV